MLLEEELLCVSFAAAVATDDGAADDCFFTSCGGLGFGDGVVPMLSSLFCEGPGPCLSTEEFDDASESLDDDDDEPEDEEEDEDESSSLMLLCTDDPRESTTVKLSSSLNRM